MLLYTYMRKLTFHVKNIKTFEHWLRIRINMRLNKMYLLLKSIHDKPRSIRHQKIVIKNWYSHHFEWLPFYRNYI